jgi:hypothetical protein
MNPCYMVDAVTQTKYRGILVPTMSRGVVYLANNADKLINGVTRIFSLLFWNSHTYTN